jgi:hypothetical protein
VSVRADGSYGLILAGLLALVYDYVWEEGHLELGGVAALVTAAVMWALYALRLRRNGPTSLQAAALICFWSAIFYLPLYIGLDLSNLSRASAGELLFQSVYQGVLMSVVAILAFNRAMCCSDRGPRPPSLRLCRSRRLFRRYRFSMAIMAVGSRHLRHRAGGHFRRCVRPSS